MSVAKGEERFRTRLTPNRLYVFKGYLITHYCETFNTIGTPIGLMVDILSWKIEDIRDSIRDTISQIIAILIVSGDIDRRYSIYKEVKRYLGI